MSRFLLVTSLFLFASAALANDPAVIGDPAAKPGKTTTVSSLPDSDTAAIGHPAAAATHSNAPRLVSPRWHSLLPGMIR